MEKPEKLRLKLLALAVFLLLLLTWYVLDLPCVLYALIGIPCPGCGMTRAWLAVFRLDLAGAFGYHPMFWCVPILLGLFVFDGQLLPGKQANNLLVGCLAAGILLTYLARLFGFLGGFPPV